MRKFLYIILLSAVIVTDVRATELIKDLSTEISEGRVELVGATGNGASSGNSVEGYLVSNSTTQIQININLNKPLFLKNRGKGQNMVATHVLLEEGRYLSDGQHSFIELKPKVRTRVDFVAYCVDFEKDNPSQTDEFILEAPPTILSNVIKNVQKYELNNRDKNVTVAAQAAVWLAQGVAIEEIRKKFDVSSEDEILARSFLTTN